MLKAEYKTMSQEAQRLILRTQTAKDFDQGIAVTKDTQLATASGRLTPLEAAAVTEACAKMSKRLESFLRCSA